MNGSTLPPHLDAVNSLKELSIKSLFQFLFLSMLVAVEAVELYHIVLTFRDVEWRKASVSTILYPWACIKAARKTYHDFSQGIFYVPWAQDSSIKIHNPDHMQQLSEAPELSQRAVYADIFGFAHNMSHSRIELNPNEDVNTMRYRLFSRSIRVIGGKQLPELYHLFKLKIEKELRLAVDEEPSVDGWSRVQLAPLMRRIATGTLGTYVFGDSLSNDPEFDAAMHDYYKDVVKSMGALKFCPSFARSLVYKLVTKNGQALRTLFNRLNPIVSSHGEYWGEKEPIKSLSLLYNMMSLSKDSGYWTPEVLIQALVGIWFAASHQPWVNLHCIFLELCERPEYIDILRTEIDSIGQLDCATLTSLPILDSFAKESARLNPLDKMGIRRKAIRPFQFSMGGPTVPNGSVVCVPAYEIMHDPTKYPNPFDFDGMRFVKKASNDAQHAVESSLRGTKFTDPAKEFPIWGFGSKACPGRYHASLVMKLGISLIIQNYDIKLERPDARHRWYWETYMMPFESTAMMFRKRGQK